MKRSVLLLLFVLCFSVRGYAITQQLILGGIPAGTLTNNATGYLPLTTQDTQTELTTANLAYTTWPTAGKLSRLVVNLGAAPGTAASGKQYTIAIYNQTGVQTLSVTISNTSTSGSDLTDKVSVAAGDTICLMLTEAGTPVAVSATWSMIFTPTVSGQTVLFGGTVAAASTASYNSFGGNFVGSANNEDRSAIILPCAGTIENLYVTTSAAPGVGNSFIFTVDNTDVPTSLTATVSGNATTSSDLTAGHAITITAGNQIDMDVTISGTPTAAQFGYAVVFVPTTPGQFAIPIVDTNGSLAAGTVYGLVEGRSASFNATETNEQQSTQPFQIKGFYLVLGTAPGGVASYTFTLRDNGASTALTQTLTGATLSSHKLTNVTIKNGDLLDTLVVPAGGPAAQTRLSLSYLGYIPPQDSQFFNLYN